MSTRATYQFTGARSPGLNHSIPTITIYIHHDGYPEGAAKYFWNAHHAARGSLNVERFLFGNDRAEITESHEAHGDTEYRYTLAGDQLTGYKRAHGWSDNEPEKWPVFFVGSVVEFINQYGASPRSFWADEFSPLRAVPCPHGYQSRTVFMSRKQLIEGAEAALKQADEYETAHPQWVGNIAGMRRVVKAWTEALEAYRLQDETKPAHVAAH
jgi:hypothetical protein